MERFIDQEDILKIRYMRDFESANIRKNDD